MTSSMGSWFRGIKGKLLFAAALPVLGFTIVYFIAHANFNTLGDLLSTSNKFIIPNLQGVGEMRQARNKFGYQIWAAMNMPTTEKRMERLKIVHQAIEEFDKGFKLYNSVPSPAELAPTDKLGNDNIVEYLALLKKCADLVESGKPEAYDEVKHQLDGRLWELGTTMNKMTTAALKYFDETALANTKTAEDTIKTANNIILFTTLTACLSIFAILMFIAGRISSSVGSIASRLTTAGSNVASSVEQLNEAGNSLSQSSTEAAASLEETVAALEELTSMVQMNSDNAKQAATLSASSREAAERGEREIQSLIQSMTTISQSSKKIEEIISVIDDIAFQTNLLALNAAVEAARAGEQGKGFAVVAEAVRSLAQRSSAAAKDITSLIKDSVSQIEDGSQIADQSGAVLTNIVTSVKKVSDLNSEIAAASSEQTTGIQQISKAMNQLDQASQSNAASAEEIAATSGEINNLAVTAQNLTVELNLVVMGAQEGSNFPTLESSSKATRVTASKQSNLTPLRRNASGKDTKRTSTNAIPFDEDTRSRVGTTDGF
ncbi:methyl-accepting chemotaxis protein [Bdellovibrio svalbardensis]|uniref:Methyl-accepting chemotaxis protein n=1 Tax=Bdellovibrio svalbardensis TaxID=2972972 RepID=A0ABT6DL12_9BACT|nr:methyl-accepting chemotaxis protein [Bdellovibrio svalbardensis]MDG0817559.1 methyl-accepting chemotaxis protein [Bdellovibrio svalbardensis]